MPRTSAASPKPSSTCPSGYRRDSTATGSQTPSDEVTQGRPVSSPASARLLQPVTQPSHSAPSAGLAFGLQAGDEPFGRRQAVALVDHLGDFAPIGRLFQSDPH